MLFQRSRELVYTGGIRQVIAICCALAVAATLSLGCKSKEKDPASGASGTESPASSGSPGSPGSPGSGGSASGEEVSTAPKLTGQKVVLRMTTTEVIVEGKSGKRTFKIGNPRPSAQDVKPIVDQVFAEGGEGGSVWIWGRYDAPYVFDVIGHALSDIPTRLCLRDGSNCSDD